MKDSKFIELLNLYVDHQISSSDAALLETEIQHNSERRRIYRQYCQMHKACAMLADNFRCDVPVGGKIVEFAPRRRNFASLAYAVGSLAAAACLALVMVNRHQAESRTPAQLTAPAIAIQLHANDPKVAPMPLPARVALQPVFAGLVRDGSTPNLALTGANRVPLDWMTRVQLEPMATHDLWFETRATTFQPQDLSFPARRPSQEQAEMTAFRFQK